MRAVLEHQFASTACTMSVKLNKCIRILNFPNCLYRGREGGGKFCAPLNEIRNFKNEKRADSNKEMNVSNSVTYKKKLAQ